MLVLLDHARDAADADALAPITTARPLAEVRAGARLIRERWSVALSAPVQGVIAARRLTGFEEPGSAPVLGDDLMLDPGTIVASSHFAPALAAVSTDTTTWTAGAHVVASRLGRRMRVSDIRALGVVKADTNGSQAMDGWHLTAPWDLIGHLPAMLAADAGVIAGPATSRTLPADVRVLGNHAVMIAPGAVIEPFVVFDATQGAIVIESQALVRSFSRITGPFVLGAHSQWLGGAGQTVSVGDHCKVNGEVSTSILCGHANKGHDGFLGHSYLGRWTNLGAGTVTSNLKNTYGPVSFNGQPTGLQFLGSMIGDHAKTGILTRLTTGSSIGAGANVISDDVVRNVVPPFSFGSSGARYDRERFFETAVRVMARRSVTMSPAMRACLHAIYDAVTAAA